MTLLQWFLLIKQAATLQLIVVEPMFVTAYCDFNEIN